MDGGPGHFGKSYTKYYPGGSLRDALLLCFSFEFLLDLSWFVIEGGVWFGPLSWTRPNADRVRMSRRYDMGEQDTTLLSLPKIALIALSPKKTQLQNCLLVYLFWLTPETFGKCVKQGEIMNMFMF